ncbi:MAG TPA: sugar ABC transporter ATP-binding protein, partial [Solirubrobacterales bacterium]
LYGKEIELPLAPGSFRDEGLAFVHQDLALVPDLTVVENLSIDRLAQPENPLRISWKQARREARETFGRYGLSIDPSADVGDLRPVERALLAIVRAAEGLRKSTEVAGHPGLLVLDEPTVFLPANSTEQLAALMRRITESGASVIFVSHDLTEVLEFTDRMTVLRDGRRVGTVEKTETDERGLIKMIIGRQAPVAVAGHSRAVSREPVSVSVDDLLTGLLEPLSFDVHRGEVLGVTGLAGSGYDDVLYALFGAQQADSGTMELAGVEHDLKKMTPIRATAAGIGLIPADRQHAGSVGTLTLEENVTIRLLGEQSSPFMLPRRRLRREAQRLLTEFEVRPADPQLPYAALSGGNQQKVLMAKWLALDPSLLLLDEPTQGVDVGAREQIFKLIREVAAGGAPIVCASSDYEQLAILCDRVLVFGSGRIVAELVGEEVNRDGIAERCYASLAGSGAPDVTVA